MQTPDTDGLYLETLDFSGQRAVRILSRVHSCSYMQLYYPQYTGPDFGYEVAGVYKVAASEQHQSLTD